LPDKTNLGATEFTEHINYRRALEGELERPPSFRLRSGAGAGSYHILKFGIPESQQPAKASVMVR
jgi:hypothetical protein